jgi:diguanylate cyclase (GGDEF)-like protein
MIPLGIGAVLATVNAIWYATGEAPGIESEMRWCFDVALFMAGLTCLTRAATTPELRGAWIAFGVGLLFWTAGDIYFVRSIVPAGEFPYPSWSDAGYLLCLPFFFVGVGLLVKQRVGRFTVDRWFDGLIAALAAGALATAFLGPALVGLTEGDPSVVFTNLAYPIGDLIVLGFILGALVLSGFRRASPILVVGAGILTWCVADMYYLYITATTEYMGGLADTLWPLGALIIAAAAHPALKLRPRESGVHNSALLPPAVSSVVVAAILVWDHFDRLPTLAVVLAGATVLAAVARLALSFRENGSLLRSLHGEAVTDSLTGLGNRRKLLRDLDGMLEEHEGSTETFMFALFDLDGFKSYNDNFGHPAGDALLERLGVSLAGSAAEGGGGTAYRLGGDEFCVLLRAEPAEALVAVERSRMALSEKGEGFSVGASVGWLMLPGDARDATEALRIVDQRMYEEKSLRSSRSLQQTHELLVRILHEREPTLTVHSDGVSEMAVQLGRKRGLGSDDLEVIARAAQLHDIGKIAIPDDMLRKTTPLDDIEWKLMKRHTLIGERILGAAVAMKPAGVLVRSSHERWDGDGYPDGLAGEEIPLGSRIIFISDSFDAMTEERPYSEAKSEADALAELRRCAGGQFDPELVEDFCDAVEERSGRAEHAPA